jgi:hypothetical protein
MLVPMNDLRSTGLAGMLVGLGSTVSVPLYFIYSGPPPAWDILTRNLLTVGVCIGMIAFWTGLRRVLQSDLLFTTGLIYTTLLLVGVSFETGVLYNGGGAPVDPTTTGPLAAGVILIHGTIGRSLTVLLLCATARAISRTRALPRWSAVLAYTIALINLAFVPSLYFGTQASTFYSALGWGNSALTASLIGYWIFAVGVALIRAGNRTAGNTAPE